MDMDPIVNIFPPLVGILVNLQDVPDPVFAEKMVGDGIAIDPLENKIYAPIDGTVKNIAKTKHAITFTDNYGIDILLHIGLDTVALNGNGFTINIREGDVVTAGIIIGEFDMDNVALVAKTLISPVILVDMDKSKFILTKFEQKITAISQPLMQVKCVATKCLKAGSDTSTNLIKSFAIKIKNAHGIHARPSAQLALIAKNHLGEIYIEKNGNKASINSLTALMKLSIEFNDTIYVYAQNQDIIDEIVNTINGFVDNLEETDTNLLSSKSLTNELQDNKYHGFVAASGLAVGKLAKLNEITFKIVKDAEDANTQKKILFEAFDIIKKDIEYAIANTINDETYKNILSTNLSLLSDPQLISDTLDMIEQGTTAAFAFNHVIDQNCLAFANSSSS